MSAYRQSLSDPSLSSLACQALLTMVAGMPFPPPPSLTLHPPLPPPTPLRLTLQSLHSAPSCPCPPSPHPRPCSCATSKQPVFAVRIACRRGSSSPLRKAAHEVMLVLMHRRQQQQRQRQQQLLQQVDLWSLAAAQALQWSTPVPQTSNTQSPALQFAPTRAAACLT